MAHWILVIIGNLNYILLICAFMFQNILYLRVLTAISSVCAIIYYALYSTSPLWINISWEIIFISVNSYQIVRLLLERNIGKLTPDEKALYQTVFYKLTPWDFKKIIKKAVFERCEAGETLIKQGDEVSSIILICQGTAIIEIDNKEIARVSVGNFVGEMSFILGMPASATVRAITHLHFVKWSQKNLHDLLEKNPELKIKFQETFNKDLVNKLIS